MAKNIMLVTSDLVLSEKIEKSLDPRYYNIKVFNFNPDIAREIEIFKPDLIVVDIISVGSNFFELMDIVKNTVRFNEENILILSQSKKIDFIVGPSPKIKGYITKPVDFEELEKLIKKNVDINKKNTIVVVDDDEDYLELVKVFLENQGYNIITVNNSKIAVDVIKKELPDLIILDLMMPGKDGFEIINELLDERKTAGIPVIVVSAVSFNKFKEKGNITGHPEYISRDLSEDTIRELIENKLNYFYSSDEVTTSPRILLADDQVELLMLMKEAIEKAGFIVDIASDGQETLEKIYSSNFDVVVLDYNMPFKNGLEIAAELKNNPIYVHIPIIIVTAKGDKESKIKGLMMGIDDYLSKPVDTDELIARLRMILKRNKQVLDTNPLSKLPGNPSIQSKIERLIEKKEKFAVLYIDLNNFKAYNDVYGFEAGDNVIKTLANMLVKIVMPKPNSTDFIGHIGGDDFIVITSYEKAEDIAKKIVSNFNQIIPSFYNERDRQNGYIEAKDRQGNTVRFPLLGVAIGIVHNAFKPLTSYAQISHIGSELKKAAKQYNKSAYVIDRRHN